MGGMSAEDFENGADGLAASKKFKKTEDIFSSMVAGTNNNSNIG